jgi:hypothetical protein
LSLTKTRAEGWSLVEFTFLSFFMIVGACLFANVVMGYDLLSSVYFGLGVVMTTWFTCLCVLPSAIMSFVCFFVVPVVIVVLVTAMIVLALND